MFNRREFLAAAPGLGAARALYGAGAIESIEHKGVLIGECSLPGERRSDGAVPAHPNGIQASRNRWLLLYATRSFRGVDDDLSIVYQIRDRTADGKQLREGFLARIERNWSPEGPGRGNYVRQLGHPVLFGVPKGARVGGRPLRATSLSLNGAERPGT